MAEPSIRPLTLADRVAWGALRQALWPDHPEGELEAELPQMIADGLVAFGAFDGDRMVAFAETGERSYGDGCDTAPVAWLEGIFVLPAYRRSGLARRLVDTVERWARSSGYSELGSDATLDNLVSRVSHARWGFEETGRSVLYRKVLR